MLKKSLLITTGTLMFIVGMIMFPLPTPIGLPLMIIGLSLLLKTSHQVKKGFIRLTHKNHHTRKAWRKVRSLRRNIKNQN